MTYGPPKIPKFRNIQLYAVFGYGRAQQKYDIEEVVLNTLIPTALRKGDTVMVSACAGVVDLKRLKTSLDLLKDHFNFLVPNSIDRSFGYLAGNDQERADEINEGLRNPDVRAIWVARGGFGLTRILHLLDPAPLQNDPKPIIGYSDVTALHAWSHLNGLRSIHGPVLNFLDTCQQEDIDHLVAGLLGDPTHVFCNLKKGMKDSDALALPDKHTRLLGGNLTVISHLIGTPYELNLNESLLMLEDVGEKPYALDRSMTHLKHSGALDGCEGLLLSLIHI